MVRSTERIATPFPIPRRRSGGGVHSGGDADVVAPLDETTETPLPPSDDINIDLDPKPEQLTGYVSEHGDPGPDSRPGSKGAHVKESSEESIPQETALISAETAQTESSWDDYSYPGELVLHYDRSPSVSKKSSESSSSSDSEPDSPIPSFCPSDSDGSFIDYSDFMSHFRMLVKTRAELVFRLDDFFEQALVFPPRLELSDWNVPEVVTSKTLKTLKISVPKSFCNALQLPSHAAPKDSDGKSLAQYEEQVICDQVMFLLQKIQSFNLQNFVFINDCNGSKVGKMSRIALWSNRLERFLNRHSYSLEKISIQSVMNHSVAKYMPIPELEEEGLFKNRKRFPHLQELDLVFWPPPHHIEKWGEGKPWLKNYWVQLLRSRERVGQLSRLVWMCPYQLHFIDVWKPILEHNKDTLKTLHILVSDSPAPKDRGESLRDKTYNFLSCSAFVKLTLLENLYLRNSQCFLQRLDLLPKTLTELALDGFCLESKDIIAALKKLTKLKKLRLVDTRFKLISMKYYAFGVDFDVIKEILNHRNLEEVFIWGYTLTQRRKRKIILEPPKTIDDDQIRKSRSKLQNLKHICLTLKSGLVNARSKAERRKAARWEEQPNLKTIEENLKKIGTLDEASITIK